jgi:tight adherence protein C
MNPFDLLPPDSGGEELIVVLASLAAFVNVFLVYRVMLVRDLVGPRVKAINARIRELRAGISGPKRRTPREKSIGVIRRIVNRMNLLRSREAAKAGLQLTRAGWRSNDALNVFLFLKLCLPIAFGAVAFLALFMLKAGALDGTQRLLVVLGAVTVGLYAPGLFVRNVISKRRKKLQKGLPDVLDLLVICAEAGQSLDAALNRISRELGSSYPELAEEIQLTSAELGLLPERRQALDNLDKRTNIAGLRGVVNTLHQSEKYGTPLAQSLRVLAAEFRNERMMKAEAKAARLPAILTVPMIVFVLPPLFVVLIGPAILRTVDMLKDW